MNFDIWLNLWHCHHNQGNKHVRHLQKTPPALFFLIITEVSKLNIRATPFSKFLSIQYSTDDYRHSAV